MSTRALVPNANGEGSLGTAEKAWGAMYVNTPETGANDQSVPSTAWVQALVAQAVASATTAIEKQAKLDAHPVGSYYFSDDSTSPATLFGGTWEALPAGYTLIAQGSGTDDFGSFTYTAGQKYGERMHKLTVEEMPTHNHQVADWTLVVSNNFNSGNYSMTSGSTFDSANNQRSKQDNRTVSAGGSQAHNIVQPSMAVYGWRRTA